MELSQLEIKESISKHKQMKLNVVKREVVEECLTEQEKQEIEENNRVHESDLRTSEEWQKICRIQVLDPDGWDRKNYQYSWYEEKISREEFERRTITSTCEFPIDRFVDIWMDKGK